MYIKWTLRRRRCEKVEGTVDHPLPVVTWSFEVMLTGTLHNSGLTFTRSRILYSTTSSTYTFLWLWCSRVLSRMSAELTFMIAYLWHTTRSPDSPQPSHHFHQPIITNGDDRSSQLWPLHSSHSPLWRQPRHVNEGPRCHDDGQRRQMKANEGLWVLSTISFFQETHWLYY